MTPTPDPSEQSASQKSLTPYQRVKKAVMNRVGVRLSREECYELYWHDQAFRDAADNDDYDLRQKPPSKLL